ncbi:MAG: adenylate kinase [Aigarchaeota archaeon]|nr:adenylate kinase [Aigarchaeota archaeon]
MVRSLRLVFLGPPGSGKGTYASIMAPEMKIPHISTGDIFRDEVARKTALGREAAGFLERGELVPDKIVVEMVKGRLNREDCKAGFILDGYPRTIGQAETLDQITGLDAVIDLKVPDSVIIDRLSTRRVCQRCGAIFNVKYMRPKKPGICDRCGGPLHQREDDRPEVIKKRLENYHVKIGKPLEQYYRRKSILKTVTNRKADVPPAVVVNRIYRALGLRKP